MNPLDARRRLLGRNVYKKTVEGNPAIAQGSLARMYPGITMQGWTEQNSTTGANLFDKSTAIKNKYISDLTGGMYDKAESDTSASDYVLVRGLSYIRVTATTFAQWMAFYDINKDFISGKNGYAGPIQVPQNAEYARFTIPNPVVDTFMVNAGSELLPWEPYTGGAPSPSPDYPQEITSAGKYDEGTGKWEYEVEVGCGNFSENTLNADVVNSGITAEHVKGNVYHISGTASDLASVRVAKCELPSGTYTLSGGDGTAPSNYRFRIRALNSGDGGIKGDAYGDAFTQSIEGGMSMLYIQVPDGATVDDDVYIMLNPGSAPLPYTPYSPPQTVTLTSDRPITKWDRMEKRNGQWGWVYKSEEIESYTDESVPGEYFSTTGRLSTGAQVWYETTTETFVPLLESEQEALNALHTFRPTTVLSNDCDCNMSLTYKTKKSLEVAT